MLLFLAIILSILLAAVVFYDLTNFIIPNWINLIIVCFYPVFLIINPEPIEWWWSLAVMGGFFAIGFLIFSLNIMGGGDIKLLIALSLWIGLKPDILMAFLLVMALSGGVLTLFLLFVRKAFLFVGSKMKTPPNIPLVFTEGEPVPYGVAIAYSFAYLLWSGKIFMF